MSAPATPASAASTSTSNVGHQAASVMVASAADCISLWDLPSSTTPLSVVNTPARTNCIRWSANNQTIASVGNDGVIRVTHAVTGSTVLSMNVNGQDGKPEVLNGVGFSSSSRFLVTGGSDAVVKIWDLKARIMMRALKGHSAAVTCVSFSPEDLEVASGGKAGDVFVHQFSSQEHAASSLSPLKLPSSCSAAVRALQYAPLRKQTLAACREDGSLQVWDTTTGATLLSMTGKHAGAATALAFSPLNAILLATVGLDSQILFYDLDNKKLIKNVQAEEALTAVAFTNDGSGLVVGTARGRVLLYDLRQAHAGPVQALAAHSQPVACVAVTHRHSSASRKASVGRPSEVGSLRGLPTSHRRRPPLLRPRPAPAPPARPRRPPPAGAASLTALAAARASGGGPAAAAAPRGPTAAGDANSPTPPSPPRPPPHRHLAPDPPAPHSSPPRPAAPRPRSRPPLLPPRPARTRRTPPPGPPRRLPGAFTRAAAPRLGQRPLQHSPARGAQRPGAFPSAERGCGRGGEHGGVVERAAAAIAGAGAKEALEAGLVRSMLEEVLEEGRREARAEMQALHVDMLRCFHELQSETSGAMRALLEQVQELTEEVAALRRESQRARAAAVFS
eukprot:tig00000144_g9072.t1